jgi:hypothetical protein
MRPSPESVEEALRRLADAAAFLRYACESAATYPATPPARALSGMADACADIQRTADVVRRSLPGATLLVELRQRAYARADES